MSTFSVHFSSDVTLTYNIIDHPVSSEWLTLASAIAPTARVDRACLYNQRHGFATDQEIESAVRVLEDITRRHRLHLPLLIERNWHVALNQLHINFPNWHRVARDSLTDAHTLNLIIHWLEYEFANKFEHRNEWLFNVDFNQDQATRTLRTFSISDYDQFTPNLEFGNIHLHYVHKGRHFLELANAQDFLAPRAHFVPQTQFSATFGMVFSEPNSRDLSELAVYHEQRGVDFFGMKYDDPRLAKGFFKLGELVDADSYRANKALRDELRNKLTTADVIGWTINEG